MIINTEDISVIIVIYFKN